MSGLGELNVLVVDDNPQMREILGAVLSGAGVRRISFAPAAEPGLERLRASPIDIVFVDYEMPGMDGLDFLAATRALPGDKRFTPIIMLTGHSDMLRLSAARDLGVTEFLAKPVTARTILMRLNAVIFHPRDFIRAAAYFGPDRRRRADADYGGPFRRRADVATVEL